MNRVKTLVLFVLVLPCLISCKMVKLHQTVARANVSVRVIGKVVDQNGLPVSGATIAASVRHWYVPGFILPTKAGRMIHLKTHSAADGTFVLRGATGDSVQIEWVQKDGYKLDSKALLGYGAVAGTPQGPVLLPMRKLPQ